METKHGVNVRNGLGEANWRWVRIGEKAENQELSPITQAEKEDLARCEKVISTKLKQFFEVGLALLEIRTRKLYREEFGSFEEYCRERWELTGGHAHRLADAAQLYSQLAPGGDIPLLTRPRVKP